MGFQCRPVSQWFQYKVSLSRRYLTRNEEELSLLILVGNDFCVCGRCWGRMLSASARSEPSITSVEWRHWRTKWTRMTSSSRGPRMPSSLPDPLSLAECRGVALNGIPLSAQKLRPRQSPKDLLRPNMPDPFLSLGGRHRLKATQLVLV